ncbi:MAG: lysine biosynthesis protein LysX [Nanoarchaeota archaeon]|nr:lysine biosynthesis protein LysX [Nanoarchaeota archaeon]
MKIGILYTIIRMEEKLIIEALKNKNIDVIKIDDKSMIIDPLSDRFKELDAVLIRSLSLTHAVNWARYFESIGITTINSFETLVNCGNKYLTTMKLIENKVPTPKTVIAFDKNSAVEAMESIGFPVVIKPIIGSWGRMIAKINDKDSAIAVLEHKESMNDPSQTVFYIQEFINKPGRDIRTIVAGNQCIGAIYRKSDNWKTNTHLGGKTEYCPITQKIKELSLDAAAAIGGGILSVDLFETDQGLLVNEINGVTEFRKSLDSYQVDIPELMIKNMLEEIKVKT